VSGEAAAKKLTDLPALRALAHPLRLQMVDRLDTRPMTVKELAAELGVARNKLHYHVNILERHGIVRAASDAGERRYEPTGRSFETEARALPAAVASGIAGILDTAARELDTQLRSAERGPMAVGRMRLSIGRANHDEFVAALDALAERYKDDAGSATFVFALYGEEE
jgi:DNA-binding transcriptional ArsR family regulator